MTRTAKSALIQRKGPRVIRSLPALRRAVAQMRAKRETVALVPTMGALHAGHLALVRLARKRARRIIVSIFVNPTQFAPNEDFGSYPRTFATDLAALAELKVDAVWAPTAKTMYPDGFATRIAPEGPALAGMEDKFRPHFFGGVATVVAKLLLQIVPDIAVFGQKDYQQLKVVTALARDLDIPVKIVGAPTVRENDGLAMSSRNAYLSAEERATAPALHRALKDCAARLKSGRPIAEALAEGRAAIERAGFMVDYFEARHAETLAPIARLADGPVRLLVAAKLGRTRLIDNIPV
ncbi:MAG: pantoate--beta-alanine ligase [Alphaproteobacteria bacterium]|nr:pantoate--beta-alanine ligase [Alphaproteobacteria bacterium]